MSSPLRNIELPTGYKLALVKFTENGSATVPMIKNLKAWLETDSTYGASIWKEWQTLNESFLQLFAEFLSNPSPVVTQRLSRQHKVRFPKSDYI